MAHGQVNAPCMAKEEEAYTHPNSAAGAKPSGLYKIATDKQGHVIEAIAVEQSNITNYGTCSTAASTKAKTVNLKDFSLTTGAVVHVRFTYTNTADAPTLNITDTGEKPIVRYGTTTAGEDIWGAGDTVTFLYDDTNWVICGSSRAARSAGRMVQGETFTVDGAEVIAFQGAEVFNNYADNKATGLYSHAEGSRSTASGHFSHAEGFGTASGDGSHAEGSGNASGGTSHAEGGGAASGSWSHAEGCSEASGDYSHAEGNGATASGAESHAEGFGTEASGYYSHAEGVNTNATGTGAHAEGQATTASGEYSHAQGQWITANNFASCAVGKLNKISETNDGALGNLAGDVFTVGNGYYINTANQERSNALRVTYAGATYGLSAFNSSGADYAEFFEWVDGNPDAEDRVGYFVTMDGKKVRKANAGEYILGIVSGQPCIIGNSDEDWLGRWEHDDFGRFIKEETEDKVVKKESVVIPVLDADGNPTGETAIEIQEVETGEVIKGWRYKANPDYDSTQPYIERKDRKEWDCIGMLGVLSVRDDGTCQVNGYCQVADGGTATAAENYLPGFTYRVMERVSDSIIKVVFR